MDCPSLIILRFTAIVSHENVSVHGDPHVAGGKMVTLTKFLVTVTFAVVFVLGTAFISGERQKSILELGDLGNLKKSEIQNYESPKSSAKEEIYAKENVRELLDEEDTDHLWDDVIDNDEDSADNIVQNFAEKSTISRNTTKKR